MFSGCPSVCACTCVRGRRHPPTAARLLVATMFTFARVVAGPGTQRWYTAAARRRRFHDLIIILTLSHTPLRSPRPLQSTVHRHHSTTSLPFLPIPYQPGAGSSRSMGVAARPPPPPPPPPAINTDATTGGGYGSENRPGCVDL